MAVTPKNKSPQNWPALIAALLVCGWLALAMARAQTTRPAVERSVVPYPHVQWAADSRAVEYRIEIAREPAFERVVLRDRVASVIRWYTCAQELTPGQYFWRVGSVYADGAAGAWSEARPLDVAAPATQFRVTPTTTVDEIRKIARRAATAAGGALIQFDPGEYFIDPGYERALFAWTDTSNIIIDGGGAHLHLTDPSSQLVNLNRCNGIVIRNLKLSHEPTPYSEVVIESVDERGASFSAKVVAGFDAGRYPREVNQMFAYALDPADPRRPHPERPGHVYLDDAKTEVLGDRQRRYAARSADDFAPLRRFKAGDRMLVIYRRWPQNWVRQCSDVVFADYAVGHSEGSLFMGGGNEAMKFLRLRSDPGEGVFPSGPGWVTGNDRLGPWLEGCAATSMSDDGPNITGNAFLVNEVAAPDTFVLQTGPGWQNPRWLVGDELMFWNPVTGEPLAEVRVVVAEALPASRTRVRVSAAPNGISAGTDLRKATHVYNLSSCNNQLVIRHCRLIGGRRFGFNIKAIGALVEHNYFEAQASSSLYFENEPSGWEGLINRDVVVQDNEFRDTGADRWSIAVRRATIHVNTWRPAPRAMSETPWVGNRNIVIRRNRILDREGIGIGVDNAADVRIEDNVITSERKRKWAVPDADRNAAIAIFGRTERVSLSNNTLDDERAGSTPVYREMP